MLTHEGDLNWEVKSCNKLNDYHEKIVIYDESIIRFKDFDLFV